MTKKTASDKELGLLHEKVARIMLRQLDAADTAMTLLEEYGEEIPTPIFEFIKKQVDASPALLSVITKFLKDNDITCNIQDSEEMSDLQKRLEDKKKRKAVGNVLAFDEDVE